MVDTALPIANGCYISDSLPVSAQCCVNWYPHINEAPSLAQEVLFGTPGIGDEIMDYVAAGPTRGAHKLGGYVCFVSGNTLYTIDQNRVIVSRGTIPGTGRLSFAANAYQLLILDPGGDGYIYNWFTEVLTEITDAGFRANGDPQYVCFVDGYFICTTLLSAGVAGSKFIASALNDGLTWNALDFGTAESSPDSAIVPIVCRNQLFIVGSLTVEQFSNTPNGAAFPFVRSGLFLPKGTTAPFSVMSYSDSFMFIGGGVSESPAVWSVDGNALTKRSTSAIDTILRGVTSDELADVFAWSYSQDGHSFVGFGLPDTTIVYDAATERWHERKSRIIESGKYVNVPYRVGSFTLLGTDLMVTDTLDGRIGFASLSTYTEYGMEIVRTVATQPFQNNMQPFFVPKLEMTVESGVGLIEGSAANAVNPSIRMQISRDGGKTWGDERSRPLGAMGEYNARAVWRRNGRCARFHIYRFTMSDPVKSVLIQLTCQIEGADDAAA